MKRIISILVIVLILAGICIIPASAQDPDVIYTTREDFLWGINHHGNGVGGKSYPDKDLEERIHLIAKSGAKVIRTNAEIEGSLTTQDQLVELCNKYGLKIIMVFGPRKDMGLDYIEMCCKALAERYNGKDGRGFVDYIQVWNETDAELIQAKHGSGGPAGNTYSAYYTIPVENALDLPEYTEYFKAAAKGIHEADSDTKFMINFCYKGWASILWYLENGVEIDVIGWDSYGQFTDVQQSVDAFKKDCDGIYNDIIKKYNVPVMIVESNTNTNLIRDHQNTLSLDTYQITLEMMKTAYSYDWIKGFVLYELLDQPDLHDGERYWGIVNFENGAIGEPKPIYREFQRLIGGNDNLERIPLSSIDLEPYKKLKVDTSDDSHLSEEDTSSSENNINIPNIDTPNIDTPNIDTPNIDTPNIDTPNIDTSDDTIIDVPVLDEPEIPNETIDNTQDVVYKKPETITKQLENVKTTYQTPWVLMIFCGVGMLVLVAGLIIVYVIVDKKKAKKSKILP